MASTSRLEDACPDLVDNFLREMGPKSYSNDDLMGFTSNFSESIGSGGYGVVYKGKLPNDVIVAVKVLENKAVVEDTFMAEVSTIGKAFHRNLVKLYGYCFEPKMKALVYEYMGNGSLDEVLYENKQSNIKWVKLYDIALDIAKGLNYLHDGLAEQIIHYDIKAGNVLLDETFSAKITDFGLAKLMNRDVSHVTLTGTRGTPGYNAPETWNPDSQVNFKCDVFSFGMMLFEILGKRKNGMEENWFPKQVWEQFINGTLEVLIRKCGIEDKDIEKANILSKVAFWCVQDSPKQRPSMMDVVLMLEKKMPVKIPPNPFRHLAVYSEVSHSMLPSLKVIPDEVYSEVSPSWNDEMELIRTQCNVNRCLNIECIWSFSGVGTATSSSWLRSVEFIDIKYCPYINTILKGVPPFGFYSCLRRLVIYECNNLKNVFSSPRLLQHVQNLALIIVHLCCNIEELIAGDEAEEDTGEGSMSITSRNTITLPKLLMVGLTILPKLKSIWRGVMVCDSIVTLCAYDCFALKKLPHLKGAEEQSPPPSLKAIGGNKEWWDSLRWDPAYPKDILQPFFEDNSNAKVNFDTSGDFSSVVDNMLKSRVDRDQDPKLVTVGTHTKDTVGPLRTTPHCLKCTPSLRSQGPVIREPSRSISPADSEEEEEIDGNTPPIHRFRGKCKKKMEIPNQLEIDVSVFDAIFNEAFGVGVFDAMFNEAFGVVGEPMFNVDPIKITEVSDESSASRKNLRLEELGEAATSELLACTADVVNLSGADIAGTSGKDVGKSEPADLVPIWNPTFEFCKRVLTVKDSCTTDPINAFNLLSHSVLPVDLEAHSKLDLATARGNHFMLVTNLIASTVDMNNRFTAVMDEKMKLVKSGKTLASVESKEKTSDEYSLQTCKDRDEEVKKLKVQLSDVRAAAAIEIEELKKNHQAAIASLKQGFLNDREAALLDLRSELEKERSAAMAAKDQECMAAIENNWKQVPSLVKQQLERFISSRAGKSGKEDSGATQY